MTTYIIDDQQFVIQNAKINALKKFSAEGSILFNTSIHRVEFDVFI